MALWRSGELETVVGGLLDESGLTEQAVLRIVAEEMREGELLEFRAVRRLRPCVDVPGF
jgi:hypothetical protein